jgi:hypothetical protein
MDDHEAPGKIKNIFDLKERLENIIGHNDAPKFNADHNHIKYATWVQAGIIDIYDNGQNYKYTMVANEPSPSSSSSSPVSSSSSSPVSSSSSSPVSSSSSSPVSSSYSSLVSSSYSPPVSSSYSPPVSSSSS